MTRFLSPHYLYLMAAPPLSKDSRCKAPQWFSSLQ
jgi:hypothetical protein